jgi:CDP-diacylglycerol---glycerol-3-phosphate 3-phosphatidyltransferase
VNVPNLLTLLRIFFVPMLVAALVQESVQFRIGSFVFSNDYLALAVFLAAAFTDLLDGFLARRWQQITTVGTLLDPIADKLLVSAALISLVQVRALAGWMAILIIGREFAVSGLRSIAASAGLTIKASDLGKTKMVSQVVAVSLALLGIQHPELRPWAAFWMWVVVFFSILSAGMYFAKFWREIEDNIKLARRREVLLLERRRQREELRRRRAVSAEGRAARAAELSN